MKLNKTNISLKYNNSVVVESYTPQNNILAPFGDSVAAEMMSLGFIPSKHLHDIINHMSYEEVATFSKSLIDGLKKIKGADVKYAPMYPNFPEQVMEASDVELFRNAIIHYWTHGAWKPDYEKFPRKYAYENVKFKEIGLSTNEEFFGIFTRILSSNDSITETDKAVLKWFIVNHSDNITVPETIPFKENMCIVAGLAVVNGNSIRDYVKTATDVLRVATYLSDGDVSLAENTKFRSLPRKQRRLLINALEWVVNEEDIDRHRGKWGKLFHSLHVGEYNAPKANAIAKKIRNNEKIETFNGKVEALIKKKDVKGATNLLVTRPGDFARRIDKLLRTNVKLSRYVVEGFLTVVDSVSTRVLTQLYGNLKTRYEDKSKRIVFPKGNVVKAQYVEGEVKKLSSIVVDNLICGIEDSLKKRFGKLESLGKVWIDPQLKECPIPSQMRSATDGAFTVARGSRLPMGDKNTLRFFIYWKGKDIDLSATFHNEKFEMVDQVSYTNLRSDASKTYHSGDIVTAPKGASEFIDVDIDYAARKARYVMMNVYVYSGPAFVDHEVCYAGWMTRDKPASNEVYDPKTVKQKLDLSAKSQNATPVIFDMVERKVIWVDLNFDASNIRSINNVHTNKVKVEDVIRNIIGMDHKMSLYDLFLLHAESRGEVVSDRAEADFVFDVVDGDVTPYKVDVISSEYVV